MSERRFTEKPELDPEAVWRLHPGHPAMMGNRTLFPSTVVDVTATEPDRLLVSGRNNRKLGATVEKGKFKGYALYGLSLEERATCPSDCSVRDHCYGNGMQMARRHRIVDLDIFADRIEREIASIIGSQGGILVRLHVLGDFPSAEYVAMWKDLLADYPALACYGYTHRKTSKWGGEDGIGDVIQAVKDEYPDRFRIRWSSSYKRPDGAVVIGRVPEGPRVEEGIVCPAQTDATACCATCGLCWEAAFRNESIAFIRHGPKSSEEAATAARGAPVAAAVPSPPAKHAHAAPATRAITRLVLPPSVKPADVTSSPPTVRLVKPDSLRVEASYQRDLSGKSIDLIRRIVANWSWAKFKPPICAETADGLFVIDGQHTAIAAASHPKINNIPVLVVSADTVEQRAASFVAHNRDRLPMSALQVFHAQCAAGDPAAKQLSRIILGVKGFVPRYQPMKGRARAGQVVAITAMQRILGVAGEAVTTRIASIAVRSELAPINSTLLYGLQILFREPHYANVVRQADDRIAAAIKSIPHFDRAAQAKGSQIGQSRYHAAAMLIAQAAGRTVRSAA